MKIYNSSGVQILDVQVEDNSFRHRVIMGDHNLTLHYSLAVHVELPVGSYCTFEGQTYTLKRPENLKMKHTRNFEYTVLLESPQADAKIWKFRNTVDGRLKFPLTAKPREHLQMFVDNMNRRGSGWSLGSCIDDVEHLISYDHDYCWDALAKMADEFNTEFEIVGKQVSLKRVEYNKNSPLALSYGKGNGFRSGIGRTSSDTMPVEFLFVQGGSVNIDRSKYGSSVLLLPKNQSISFDGEFFEDESGYNATNARTYVVDNLGLSIRRSDKSPSTYAEDSLDCSSVYPKRVGTISSVVTVDVNNNFYDIVDSSIPSTLDYSACQIEGEKLTVTFQSGMLAGHGEFEVNYFHEAVSGKAARRFEIVPKDEDGYTMPNETFKPAAGNTYVVFKCMLPDAYVCDNSTKSGAEWDMFRSAVRYMFNHEEEIFTFKGELDSLWAKQDWANIGGKIILGGYIQFTDARFQPSGVLVRIVGIKDYVNNPHKPEIELSNQTVSAGFGAQIKQLESYKVETEEYHRDAISFTKRRFRDAKETMDMLNALLEAGFENFTGNITPITIQTMQMLVGDESLQYRFVNNKTTPSTVAHNVAYNASTKVLTAPAGILQHMTLGISNLSSSHSVSEYKFWDITAYTSAVLSDASKRYYLYVRVSRTGTTGVFLLRETAISMTADGSYYYFLYGLLNSEYDGERSFVPLYGFTEVLPGRVTTDRVVSADGNGYFDMVNDAMKLGDALDFNSQGDGKLRIKGTIVQSQGGTDESPIGVFRGVWNSTYVYYVGDEVVYTADRITSYYRCIQQTAAGIVPTNTLYWQVLSAGVKGHIKARAFIRTNTDISSITPTGGSYASPVPTSTVTSGSSTLSWSDGIPDGTAMLWSTVCWFYSDGTSSGWSSPARETDTDTLDIEFSPSTTQPSAPTGDTPFANHEREGWYDPSSANFPTAGTMIWRGERKVSNGVYDGGWVITRIYGEKGNTGQSSFKSTVFCRTNTTPIAPIAAQGTYAQPHPPTGTSWPVYDEEGDTITGVYWHDGIPDGEAILWACTRIFSSDGLSPQQAAWSDPRQMTDTDTFDVEFALMQTNDATPATPTDNNRHKDASPYGYTGQVWFDPDLDKYSASGVRRDFKQMYWRAEREKKNGVWSDWVIVRIKGETGNAGRSVSSFTEYYALTTMQTGVTYNNVTWVEGRMPTGDEVNGPYLWNYEEITYSYGNSTKTPPALIGHNASDGRSITGVTEHYLASPNSSGITTSSSGWTDDPTQAVLSPTNKYLWNYETISYSSGSPTNTTPVIIGAYGDVGGFKSVVFCRCNNIPDTPSETQTGTYNTYANPVPPAGTDSESETVNWYDAIPSGTAKVWASSCIFYSNGTKSNWSTPRQMTDTATYDVEFCPYTEDNKPSGVVFTDGQPPAPTTANRHGGSGTQVWFDPDLDKTSLPSGYTWEDMVWRAEKETVNGVAGAWVISRIKGEDGDAAEYYRLKVSSSTVKRDGNTMSPGTVTFSVEHVVGGSETTIDTLPTGWYCVITRMGTSGSITGNQITTTPYTIVTGNLFGWTGGYNYARMDLYDENNQLRSSADVSLCMDGDDAVSVFKSTAFIRLPAAAGTPSTPTGGTWDSPVPTSTVNVASIHATFSWSDGIPEGEYALWESTRVFYSDNRTTYWTTPRKVTDTASYDVEFAPMQTDDATPAPPDSTNRHDSDYPYGYTGQVWFDPDDDKYSASGVARDFTVMYWKAERLKIDGEWGAWAVTRIKGEQGNKGDDAPYYLYKYQWNGSPTSPPDVSNTTLNPGNSWSGTQPSQTSVLSYLWMIFARVSGDGTSLLQNWSTPVRVTPSVIGNKIEVKGTHNTGVTTDNPYCYVGGTSVLSTYSRGLNLIVLQSSTLNVVYRNSYDTYTDTTSSPTNTNLLITRLNQYLSKDYIIILFSYDAISVHSSLFTCLQKFGCGFREYLYSERYAFAFIGQYGLEIGQGVWKGSFTDDVEIAATVLDGEFIGRGATGEVGENLVNNSEVAETFSVTESGNNTASDGQFVQTAKSFQSIPKGKTISGQVRITLSGCTFKDGGGAVLVYFGSNLQWPTIGEKTGITENGTYDLKNVAVSVADNSNETWSSYVHIRLNNFYAGGTITIERVKVEVGLCTEYSLSPADLRGPGVVFRGDYSAAKTYYGTSLRVDCVKSGSTYYVARADAGAFSNVTPPNASYWNEFGGQFDSVATQLLLAELANIAGWIFRNSRMESQRLTNGTYNTGANTSGYGPMAFLDGVNGSASFAGGKVVFNQDGSVDIGFGKFHITPLGDVTMQDITANSGTFKGVINANAGLIMPVLKSSASSVTLTPETVILICQNTSLSDSQEMLVTLPASPNVGQVLTIINNNTHAEVKIYGNGHRICPSNGDSGTDTKSWTFGYYLLLATIRAKQFVFDGTYWWQINMFDGY